MLKWKQKWRWLLKAKSTEKIKDITSADGMSPLIQWIKKQLRKKKEKWQIKGKKFFSLSVKDKKKLKTRD